MKISLTQGKFAIVSPRDYKYLMQWKWCYNCGYVVRTDRTNGQQAIYMHRIILERMGFKNFARSDHVNRNKLDNRRCNLRPVTPSQSQCNRDKQSNNTSGHKGVCWSRRKWYVRIQINGKSVFLGYFDSKKEAVRAYNKAVLKYHGEFAVLNEV